MSNLSLRQFDGEACLHSAPDPNTQSIRDRNSETHNPQSAIETGADPLRDFRRTIFGSTSYREDPRAFHQPAVDRRDLWITLFAIIAICATGILISAWSDPINGTGIPGTADAPIRSGSVAK
jgi:hypothetical protein